MTRCEVCNRKLKDPTKRFCGSKKCTADIEDYIDRCDFCGGLLIEGKVCPSTGTWCKSSEEGSKYTSFTKAQEVI